MAESVGSRIAQQYPFLAFLINDPQVGPLLRRAVDLNTPYSAEKFTAELMKTNWWRKKSDSAREWQIIANTRPGEALQQRQIMNVDIQTLAAQMGIKLTSRELLTIREAALRSGQSGTSQGVKNYLIALTRKGGRTTGVGQWATTAQQLRSMSQSEFFKPLPDHVARKWAEWIVGGTQTLDDFKAANMKEAAARYPHMADAIREGRTPADIINPLRELVAQELEYGSPAQVSMTNPTWRGLTGVRDPKTNKMRMPTESEVIRMARSLPEWWKTSNGREADAGMASTLLNIFGKRKMAA